MSSPESAAINDKETGDKFPKLSKIEFLRRLEEADLCSPRNPLYSVKSEQLKRIGLPSGEVSLDGRLYNPIREAIEKSRVGGISGMLAVEIAWDYYNSLTAYIKSIFLHLLEG